MKPTYDELRAYVNEKGYSISPKRFFEHYDARSWKANGEDIRNWKALVDTWEKKGDMFPGEDEGKEETEETEEERESVLHFISAEIALRDDVFAAYTPIAPKDSRIPPLDFVKLYTECFLENKPEFTYNDTEVTVNLERKID